MSQRERVGTTGTPLFTTGTQLAATGTPMVTTGLTSLHWLPLGSPCSWEHLDTTGTTFKTPLETHLGKLIIC
jgi:hypothetical protein